MTTAQVSHINTGLFSLTNYFSPLGGRSGLSSGMFALAPSYENMSDLQKRKKKDKIQLLELKINRSDGKRDGESFRGSLERLTQWPRGQSAVCAR